MAAAEKINSVGLKLCICGECGKLCGIKKHAKWRCCPYCGRYKLELYDKTVNIILPDHRQFELLRRLHTRGKIQIGEKKV